MEQSIQEDTEPQVGSSESIEIQEKKTWFSRGIWAK